MRRMSPVRLAVSLIVLGTVTSAQELSVDQQKRNIESFEFIWSTVRDQYWDPTFGGLNWKAVHDELRPRMDHASTMADARRLMRQMIDRLGKSHFAIIPEDVYGDLDAKEEAGGTAITGIDVRVLDGKAIVTAVEAGSSAASQGVHAGWEIVAIDGRKIAPELRRITELDRDSTMLDLHLARFLQARLSGSNGSRAQVDFLDDNRRRVVKEIERNEPPGALARFGYLPPMHVWFKSRRVAGDIEYLTFNFFLDPANLMPQFGDSLKSCADCAGVVIDLRGNPGGLGVMATGMAGWFIDQPNQVLGTMHMRQGPIKFAVNPRLPTYRGAVAILADGCSASTSEILAQGLKDLGRARIFGTRTAGAALPSAIDRLPNGDGFQHAVADYVSESGRSLEGSGVTPDLEVKLTRDALLAGRDPVLAAAIEWMHLRK